MKYLTKIRWGRREKIVGNGEVLGGKKWGKTPYGEPQHQLWYRSQAIIAHRTDMY